ncbi:MAG TPA: hypothetical protein VF721_17920 [Pyrinomonadaceae bacterium]|jgi:hypothetical protein
MKNRLTILGLAVVTVLALSINNLAQNKSAPEPISKSVLTGADLPPGAMKIKESSLPDEIKKSLANFATIIKNMFQAVDQKANFRQGALEVISWSLSGNNKSKSEQITKKVESNLQTAGWKYEPSEEKGAAPALFSLVRTEPKPRRLIGFFALKDDSLFFVVTEIIREEANAATVINVTGKWNMIAETQGQYIPVLLELKQDGEIVSGTFSSHIGNGTIREVKVSGNIIKAIAKVEVQKQIVELKLDGTVEGEKMSGTLTAAGLPKISFTATKVK